MANPNSTTCGACGKWTIAGANYCHHCANPLRAQFNSDAPIIPFDEKPHKAAGNHWLNTDGGRWLAGAFTVLASGAALAWLNDFTPGQGAIVAAAAATIGGGGLLLAKWRLEKPGPILPTVTPQALKITIHEPELSGGRVVGMHTYLDQFDSSITLEDLQGVARAANFSREAMAKAGLSQPKARRVQSEFLRLNYACPLPNGKPGYALTLRGRKLLEATLSPRAGN